MCEVPLCRGVLSGINSAVKACGGGGVGTGKESRPCKAPGGTYPELSVAKLGGCVSFGETARCMCTSPAP